MFYLPGVLLIIPFGENLNRYSNPFRRAQILSIFLIIFIDCIWLSIGGLPPIIKGWAKTTCDCACVLQLFPAACQIYLSFHFIWLRVFRADLRANFHVFFDYSLWFRVSTLLCCVSNVCQNSLFFQLNRLKSGCLPLPNRTITLPIWAPFPYLFGGPYPYYSAKLGFLTLC